MKNFHWLEGRTHGNILLVRRVKFNFSHWPRVNNVCPPQANKENAYQNNYVRTCTNLFSKLLNLDVDLNVWFLFFDVSKLSSWPRSRCTLRDLKGYKYLMSNRLYFLCTNNVTKYEALIQYLEKVIDLDAKKLQLIRIDK